MKWHEDRSDFLGFLNHLVYDHVFDGEQLLGVVEKPWKWDAEHALWKEVGTAFPDEDGYWKCDRCGSWQSPTDSKDDTRQCLDCQTPRDPTFLQLVCPDYQDNSDPNQESPE